MARRKRNLKKPNNRSTQIEAPPIVKSPEEIHRENQIEIAHAINRKLDNTLYSRPLYESMPALLVAANLNILGLSPAILLPLLSIPKPVPAIILGFLACFPTWMLATSTGYEIFLRLMQAPHDIATLGLMRRSQKHVNTSLPYTKELNGTVPAYIQGIASGCVSFYSGTVLLERLSHVLSLPSEYRQVVAILNGISAFITNTAFLDARQQTWLNRQAAKENGPEDYTFRLWQDKQLLLLQEKLITSKDEKFFDNKPLGEILAAFIQAYSNPPSNLLIDGSVNSHYKISEHTKLLWRLYQLEKLSDQIISPQANQLINLRANRALLNWWWSTGEWVMSGVVIAACLSYLDIAMRAADEENSPFFIHDQSARYLLGIYFGLSSFHANTLINTQMNAELMHYFRLLGFPQGILTLPWKELSNPKRTVEVAGIAFAAVAALLMGYLSYQFPLFTQYPMPLIQALVTGLGSFPLALRPIIKGFDSALITSCNWYYGWSGNYKNMSTVYAHTDINQKKLLTNYLTHTVDNLVKEFRQQTQRVPMETVKEDFIWTKTLNTIGTFASNRYSLFNKNMPENSLYAEAVKKLEQKDFKTALAKIKNYLATKPYDANGWHKQGNIQLALDNKTEANESFMQALKLDPNKAEIYQDIGDLHLSLGEKGYAKENYQKCLELDPQNTEVKEKLRQLVQQLEGKMELR